MNIMNRSFLSIIINVGFISCDICYNSEEAAARIQQWIQNSVVRCKSEKCSLVQFYDTEMVLIKNIVEPSNTFIMSRGVKSRHPPGWQGLLHYTKTWRQDAESEGVYVYPDWRSCVTGTWNNNLLVTGHYCSIKSVCFTGAGEN